MLVKKHENPDEVRKKKYVIFTNLNVGLFGTDQKTEKPTEDYGSSMCFLCFLIFYIVFPLLSLRFPEDNQWKAYESVSFEIRANEPNIRS